MKRGLAAALALLLIPLAGAAHAQVNAQVIQTEQCTRDVDFALEPDAVSAGEPAKMKIGFVNPNTERIQEHIDYEVTVSAKDGAPVKSIPLTHTSSGSVSIPVEFESDGAHTVQIGIKGILFQPIPLETVQFGVTIGGAAAEEEVPGGNAAVGQGGGGAGAEDGGAGDGAGGEDGGAGRGGGCLIATAAYGTEMAGQVQLLREVRDGAVMQTHSGALFMEGFSAAYYAVSPAVADLERQSPAFQEAVRLGIAPMLATMSILGAAEIDSDGEMIARGLAVVMINAGLYAGLPIVSIFSVRRLVRVRRAYGARPRS